MTLTLIWFLRLILIRCCLISSNLISLQTTVRVRVKVRVRVRVRRNEIRRNVTQPKNNNLFFL